jgi:hypothetical protein
MEKKTEVYHILKGTEGGMGQRTAIDLLKDEGIKAVKGPPSCYVGHCTVIVTGTEKEHEKASNILFH